MSVAIPERASAPRARADRRAGPRAVYGVELAKISAQLLPRLAVLVCLAGPFVFAVIMKTQTSAPADTLFGRWVHSSGFSIPFVVLGFAGVAGFPLLASIVAGDIFAGEDRQSTWKTLLARSCSRGDVFVGKVLAAITFSVATAALLALSSLAAGVLVVGTQPLISLSGAALSPGHAIVLVLESWATALIPLVGFTCVGVLFSVASRNSLAGVLGPPVIGLVMVLLSLMGSGVVVRSLLLTTAFEAWHGLLVAPEHFGPLLVGTGVTVGYALLCLDAAHTKFRKRDFAGDLAARTSWRGLLRGTVVTVVIAALLALASTFDRTWITSDRLQTSVAATFRNLVVVQQGILGHAEKARSFSVFPFCKRERVITGPSKGSGDDWICALNVNGPRLGQLSVTYALVVRPNGCYTAEGSAEVTGPLHIRDSKRRAVINPLYAFDGCVVSP